MSKNITSSQQKPIITLNINQPGGIETQLISKNESELMEQHNTSQGSQGCVEVVEQAFLLPQKHELTNELTQSPRGEEDGAADEAPGFKPGYDKAVRLSGSHFLEKPAKHTKLGVNTTGGSDSGAFSESTTSKQQKKVRVLQQNKDPNKMAQEDTQTFNSPSNSVDREMLQMLGSPDPLVPLAPISDKGARGGHVKGRSNEFQPVVNAHQILERITQNQYLLSWGDAKEQRALSNKIAINHYTRNLKEQKQRQAQTTKPRKRKQCSQLRPNRQDHVVVLDSKQVEHKNVTSPLAEQRNKLMYTDKIGSIVNNIQYQQNLRLNNQTQNLQKNRQICDILFQSFRKSPELQMRSDKRNSNSPYRALKIEQQIVKTQNIQTDTPNVSLSPRAIMRSRLPGAMGQSQFQSRNVQISDDAGPSLTGGNHVATQQTNQSHNTSKIDSNRENPRRKSVSSTINTHTGNQGTNKKDDEKKYLVSNDYTIKVPKYGNNPINSNHQEQQDTKKLTTDLESIVKDSQYERKLKKSLQKQNKACAAQLKSSYQQLSGASISGNHANIVTQTDEAMLSKKESVEFSDIKTTLQDEISPQGNIYNGGTILTNGTVGFVATGTPATTVVNQQNNNYTHFEQTQIQIKETNKSGLRLNKLIKQENKAGGKLDKRSKASRPDKVGTSLVERLNLNDKQTSGGAALSPKSQVPCFPNPLVDPISSIYTSQQNSYRLTPAIYQGHQNLASGDFNPQVPQTITQILESDFSKAHDAYCNTNTFGVNKNMYDSSEDFPSTRVLSGPNTAGRRSNLEIPQNLEHSFDREGRIREIKPIKIIKKVADGKKNNTHVDMNLNLDLPIQIVSQNRRPITQIPTPDETRPTKANAVQQIDEPTKSTEQWYQSKDPEASNTHQESSKTPLGFNMISTRKEQRMNIYKKLLHAAHNKYHLQPLKFGKNCMKYDLQTHSEQEMLEIENEKRNVQIEIRSVFDCIEGYQQGKYSKAVVHDVLDKVLHNLRIGEKHEEILEEDQLCIEQEHAAKEVLAKSNDIPDRIQAMTCRAKTSQCKERLERFQKVSPLYKLEQPINLKFQKAQIINVIGKVRDCLDDEPKLSGLNQAILNMIQQPCKSRNSKSPNPLCSFEPNAHLLFNQDLPNYNKAGFPFSQTVKQFNFAQLNNKVDQGTQLGQSYKIKQEIPGKVLLQPLNKKIELSKPNQRSGKDPNYRNKSVGRRNLTPMTETATCTSDMVVDERMTKERPKTKSTNTALCPTVPATSRVSPQNGMPSTQRGVLPPGIARSNQASQQHKRNIQHLNNMRNKMTENNPHQQLQAAAPLNLPTRGQTGPQQQAARNIQKDVIQKHKHGGSFHNQTYNSQGSQESSIQAKVGNQLESIQNKVDTLTPEQLFQEQVKCTTPRSPRRGQYGPPGLSIPKVQNVRNMSLKGVKSKLQNRRQVVQTTQTNCIPPVSAEQSKRNTDLEDFSHEIEEVKNNTRGTSSPYQLYRQKNTPKDVIKYTNEITQIHQELKKSKEQLASQELTCTQLSKTQMSQNTKELITEQDLDGEALTPQQCSERGSHHSASNKVLKSRINQRTVINSQEINVKFTEDGEEISVNNTQTFSPLQRPINQSQTANESAEVLSPGAHDLATFSPHQYPNNNPVDIVDMKPNIQTAQGYYPPYHPDMQLLGNNRQHTSSFQNTISGSKNTKVVAQQQTDFNKLTSNTERSRSYDSRLQPMMKPTQSENPFQAPISIHSNQFGLFNKQDQLGSPEQESIEKLLGSKMHTYEPNMQDECNYSPPRQMPNVKVTNMEDSPIPTPTPPPNRDLQEELEDPRGSQHYVDQLRYDSQTSQLASTLIRNNHSGFGAWPPNLGYSLNDYEAGRMAQTSQEISQQVNNSFELYGKNINLMQQLIKIKNETGPSYQRATSRQATEHDLLSNLQNRQRIHYFCQSQNAQLPMVVGSNSVFSQKPSKPPSKVRKRREQAPLIARKKTIPVRSAAPEQAAGFDFHDTQYSEQKLGDEFGPQGQCPPANIGATFTGTEMMNDYESNASIGRHQNPNLEPKNIQQMDNGKRKRKPNQTIIPPKQLNSQSKQFERNVQQSNQSLLDDIIHAAAAETDQMCQTVSSPGDASLNGGYSPSQPEPM